METITSINYYSSAWNLYNENSTGAELAALSEDMKNSIKHVDDFEPYAYVIINDVTVHVIDSFNGDVINAMTLEEFKAELLEYMRGDLEP